MNLSSAIDSARGTCGSNVFGIAERNESMQDKSHTKAAERPSPGSRASQAKRLPQRCPSPDCKKLAKN